jgi:hypothetical protein
MPGGAPGGQAPPTGSSFSLGWLMAQLFGPLQHWRGRDTPAHLSTVPELGGDNLPARLLGNRSTISAAST